MIGFLLSGCSDQEASPEDRIRTLLNGAEEAVEKRSLSDAAELISPDYRDQAGRDRRAMKRLLLGYFLRNQSIHVLKQVRQIDLLGADRARVVLYAGVAGQRPGEGESLQQWGGDLVRLEANLVMENGDWRLIEASWRRASQGDLL